MAPITIVDSHIHLWPQSAAGPHGHRWMKEGEQLTKQQILSDYFTAAKQNTGDSSDAQVEGVVYIETDRTLKPRSGLSLEQWAAQPLEEIRFLRSILEGEYGDKDSKALLGLVLWAPVDQGLEVFLQWLKLAEEAAGPATWSRVKGFRFLLQGITDRQHFESLVFSEGFLSVIKAHATGGRDFCFDAGVDQHSGGVWQLEAFANVIERLHDHAPVEETVTFILNHLCKPDLSIGPSAAQSSDDFKRWCDCIKRFSSYPKVYMKLSGAFSELANGRMEISSPTEIADRMKPWLNHLFLSFPSDRIMFGSDWPVCNIGGPLIEESWSVWKDVVKVILDQRGFSEQDKHSIWSGTAVKAYKLNVYT